MRYISVLTSFALLALVTVGSSDANAIDAGLVAQLANGTIVLENKNPTHG